MVAVAVEFDVADAVRSLLRLLLLMRGGHDCGCGCNYGRVVVRLRLLVQSGCGRGCGCGC